MTDADRPKPISGTLLRFATAIPLIAVVLWVLFGRTAWAFDLLLAVALTICSLELVTMMLPARVAAKVFGVVSTLGLVAAFRFADSPVGISLALVAIVVGVLIVSLIAPKPIESAALRAGWLLGTPFYLRGLAVPLLSLFALPDGGAWVLLAMFYAFLSDTCAYFSGRAFGRRPLMPTVSPKKTVEGAIGGIVGATLGGIALQATLLDRLPLVHMIPLGVIAAATGQAGDLFASLLKRSAGVKDSGRLLPGHGGLLDRIDALLFTGAITWAYATWIAP